MAANYGWALSFLKAHGELWKLFQKATKKNYSTQRFVAELRNTKWFQKNSDTYRQTQVLQKTDPATYAQRHAQKYASIQDLAAQMGAHVSGKQLAAIATNAIDFGWDDATLKNAVGGYVQQMGGGHFGGEAGKSEDELRSYAQSMGITVSDATITNWVRNIAVGNSDTQAYKSYVQTQAQNTFAPYASQIKSGQTVADLAQPYVQQMASVLELDPNALNVFDPTIRKALNGVDPTTGKPNQIPLWQFEQQLKQDPRWLSTDNAKTSLLGAGQKVLQDFGLHF
jgi:hypothetical protein